MRAHRLAALCLAVAVLAACDSSPEGTSIPTSEATSTPGAPVTPTPTASASPTAMLPPLIGYAADVRTYGPEETIINGYLRNQVTLLLGHIEFHRYACTPDVTGMPPCPPGLLTDDGQISAIPLLGCEPAWAISREDLLAPLRSRGVDRALYAYAPVGPEHHPATQVLVFNWLDEDGRDHGVALLIASFRIVGVDHGCEESAADLYAKYASGEGRLPPATVANAPAPPLPPPPGHERGTSAGHAMVDAVVEAYLANDGDALAALAAPTEYECVERSIVEYGPPPVCPDGVEVGTPIAVLGSVGCHGGYMTVDQVPGIVASPLQVARRLYAVIQQPGASGPQYEALFATQFRDGKVWGSRLTITEDGFTGFDGGCGTAPDEMLARWAAPTLLPAPPEEAEGR